MLCFCLTLTEHGASAGLVLDSVVTLLALDLQYWTSSAAGV